MKRIVLLILILTLIAGCFNNKKEKIEININKDISNLYPEEEFKVEISGNNDSIFSIIFENKNYEIKSGENIVLNASTEKKESRITIKDDDDIIFEKNIKISKTVLKKIVYVYMAADNDLTLQSLKDMEEMRIGTEKNSDLKYFIFLDRLEGNLDNCYMIIEDGKERILKNIEEKNTGNTETLKEFIKYGDSCFESTNKTMVIWSHGDGWKYDKDVIKKSVGYDWNEDDSLNVLELKEGLSLKKWDMIIFDACLMNGIETAYQLRNSTDYILGSPEETPVAGYNYEEISNILNEETDREIIGEKIIDSSILSLKDKDEFAVYSLIKTSEIASLAEKIGKISEGLSDKITIIKQNKEDMLKNILTYSSKNGDYTQNTDYADIGDLFNYLNKIKVINNEDFTEMNNLLNKAVIYNKYVTNSEGLQIFKSSGISIYFPLSGYDEIYNSATEFGIFNLWNTFIKNLQ